MKTLPTYRHFAFSGLFLLLLSFVIQPVFAGSPYKISVVIHEYYGHRGNDTDGNRLYGVKVRHKNDFYYVEMHNPMPCLKSHLHETAWVTINRKAECWGDVTFNGHSARVHNVLKMEGNCVPSHGHNHTAGNQHKKKPWRPWMISDLFF